MTKQPIEAIYPLSPMQQGMLFHSVSAPASGVYVEQFHCALHGPLDAAIFEQAWQRVVGRHAVLRTAFAWERHDKPLQVVARAVRMPWTQHDWSALPAQEQQERLAALLADDRRAGFNLAKPPLTRGTLIRLSAQVYQLIWTFHHLLLDGWSVALVLDEVLTVYAALAQGQEAMLAPSRPYQDYIRWLQQQDLAEAEQFWRALLGDLAAPTPLGVGRATPGSAPPSAPAQQRRALAAAATARLHHFARAQQITLNTLVQAAWALLLQRYSGQRTVVFGTTVAGRPPELPGVEQMVGLFINTLPLRVHLPATAPVGTWLAELQALLLELRQFEYSPLVTVQRWSAVPPGTPLFDSIVVFENYPVGHTDHQETPAIELRRAEFIEQTNYPLTLAAMPEDQQLVLQIDYHPARFEAATIERMLGHLATLLHELAADPERCLDDVPLLTAAERRQVLGEWSTTSVMPPPDQTVIELFAAQAQRTPDAIAVDDGRTRLSYAALDQRANQLAHYLRARGVGGHARDEVRIGLYLSRSLELVVGILGILKAGGAYVPFDPTHPRARLQLMLDDARVSMLLTVAALLPGLGPDMADVLCLDRERDAIERQPTTAPPGQPAADQLAYIIYTSGSTGRPKGVLLAQRGLSNLVQAQRAAFAVAAGHRVLQFASTTFDASVSELFVTLVSGATLVLPPPDALLGDAGLAALLRDGAISHVTLPPSVLATLPDDKPPTLQTLVVAGEACPPELAARWERRLQAEGGRFINAYGPTEATVCATVAVNPSITDHIPIGRALPNVEVYVLDERLEPVPIGVMGELYLGGIQLARGYHNRPDLTAAAFIPNPFGHDDWRLPMLDVGLRPDQPPIQHLTSNIQNGSRLYKTGDLARYRPDGQIEFLGRIDHQVKLHGFRIELGEIEAALRQIPGVRDTVVIAQPDPRGDHQLVGYVVWDAPWTANREQGAGDRRGQHSADGLLPSAPTSTDTARLQPAELRGRLRERLPDYMVPSAFVTLDALPLSATGKINRAALPAPDHARSALTDSFVRPRDTLELQLAQIWERALDVHPIGVTDNFFMLGGHSLLAMRIMAQIQKQLAQQLPLSALLQATTIEQLAALLRQDYNTQLHSPLVPIRADGAEMPFFCVHPGGGDVLCYYHLAQHLPADRPFYGLQDPEIYGEAIPATPIEELAGRYIAAIQTVRPEGPYLLGGYSFGGIVAFEMAQQLQRQGQSVALLAVLDGGSPESADAFADDDALYLAIIGLELTREATGLSLQQLHAALQPLNPAARLDYILDLMRQAKLDLPDNGPQWVERHKEIFKSRIRVIKHYQPPVYDGSITLFRASDLDEPEQSRDLGWRKLSRRPIEIYTVPGHHDTILNEPYVHALAEQLDACLKQAAAGQERAVEQS